MLKRGARHFTASGNYAKYRVIHRLYHAWRQAMICKVLVKPIRRVRDLFVVRSGLLLELGKLRGELRRQEIDSGAHHSKKEQVHDADRQTAGNSNDSAAKVNRLFDDVHQRSDEISEEDRQNQQQQNGGEFIDNPKQRGHRQ